MERRQDHACSELDAFGRGSHRGQRGEKRRHIPVAGPVVLAAMVVGVAIALLQALTQVQEMTLTFVPKLVVIFFVFSLTASFIGAQFYVYTERVYARIAQGGHHS